MGSPMISPGLSERSCPTRSCDGPVPALGENEFDGRSSSKGVPATFVEDIRAHIETGCGHSQAKFEGCSQRRRPERWSESQAEAMESVQDRGLLMFEL